jgi:hypothetical protein
MSVEIKLYKVTFESCEGTSSTLHLFAYLPYLMVLNLNQHCFVLCDGLMCEGQFYLVCAWENMICSNHIFVFNLYEQKLLYLFYNSAFLGVPF